MRRPRQAAPTPWGGPPFPYLSAFPILACHQRIVPAAAFKEKCDARGFFTISERDELATLYPEGAGMEAVADEYTYDSEEEKLPKAA